MGDLLSLKKVIKKVISPILTFSSTNLGINNLFVEYYQVLYAGTILYWAVPLSLQLLTLRYETSKLGNLENMHNWLSKPSNSRFIFFGWLIWAFCGPLDFSLSQVQCHRKWAVVRKLHIPRNILNLLYIAMNVFY
jgi:hypothetical protein